MNATAKRAKRANLSDEPGVNLPALRQMAALSIWRAESQLASLVKIRCDDEDWDESDVDVDMAVELALSHVRRMKGLSFDNHSTFDGQWYLAASAVALANRAFSRQDFFYGRALRGASLMFDQAASFVEYASIYPVGVPEGSAQNPV